MIHQKRKSMNLTIMKNHNKKRTQLIESFFYLISLEQIGQNFQLRFLTLYPHNGLSQ